MERPLKILASVPPRPDENLRGYLLRISELNGYQNPLWLRQAAGLELQNISSMEHVRALAHLLRRKPEEMVHMSLISQPGYQKTHRPFLQAVTHCRFIELQDVRLCPACQRHDPYMRMLWDFRPLPCCPTHETYFATHCPKCQEPISKSRRGVTTCVCEHDLTDISCDRATDAEIWLAKLIATKAIGTDLPTAPERLSPILAMSLDELARLISFIGGTTAAGRSSADCHALQNDAAFITWMSRSRHAAEIIYGWPTSAHGFFDGFLLRLGHPVRDRTPPPEVRAAYARAASTLTGSAYEFFRQEFATYIDHEWPADELQMKSKLLTESVHGAAPSHVAGLHVQKTLNITRDQLIKLVENGRLSGTILRLPARTKVFVERSSFEAFGASPIEKIDMKEACRRLGLSTAIVTEMATSGMLDPVRFHADPKVFHYVTAGSIQAVLNLFNDARPQPGCDEIEMHHMLSNYRNTGIWFPTLLLS